MATHQTDRIISHLWQSVEGAGHLKVYALVDAARSETIYPKIMGAKVKSACLHRGKMAEELAWVAPYLVQLGCEDTFTKWLFENGWGKSWGVIVNSSSSFSEIKRHFQTFLTVYDEDGKSYFFRFYDPRVFRAYLPTCNEKELEIVYGPVTRFHMEGEKENQLIEYICSKEFKLVQNETILQDD